MTPRKVLALVQVDRLARDAVALPPPADDESENAGTENKKIVVVLEKKVYTIRAKGSSDHQKNKIPALDCPGVTKSSKGHLQINAKRYVCMDVCHVCIVPSVVE